MTCICMNSGVLVKFLKELFKYKPKYGDVIKDVTLKIKSEITS